MEDRRLSMGALHLLRILKDYARGKNYCWPGQTRLAQMLGRSERMIRRYIRELESAGVISVLQTGCNRTNRYIPDHQRAPISGPDRTPMSGPDRTPMSGPDRTPISGPDRTPISGPEGERHYVLNLEEGNSSSSKPEAAAAAVAPSLPKPKQLAAALDALKTLGVKTTAVAPMASADPELACVAAAWLKRRLVDSREPPIRNVTRFAIRLLQHPQTYSFERGPDGAWQPPDAEDGTLRNLARDEAVAKKRSADEEVRRRAAETERWYRHYRDVWDKLPAEEREAIRTGVIANAPLLVGKDPDGFTTISMCLRVLEKREKEGGGADVHANHFAKSK